MPTASMPFDVFVPMGNHLQFAPNLQGTGCYQSKTGQLVNMSDESSASWSEAFKLLTGFLCCHTRIFLLLNPSESPVKRRPFTWPLPIFSRL